MTLKTLPKKPFKYNCPNCDYGTNRKWSFEYHTNRKIPCKPKENESTNNDFPQESTVQTKYYTEIHKIHENVHTNPQNSPSSNDSPAANVCKFCNKMFSRNDSLKRHLTTCKAKKENSKTENERLQEEIVKLKSALAQAQKEGPQVINNYITNNDNSTTNHMNNTNNIINYNNFDSPNFDHITKEMIGEMYLKADRELPRMIGNAVRKIYKGLPENDTIRFKYGNQAGFAEVRQDNETRILPVSDVLETVLSQTSTLCGKELRKCCRPDMIPGPNVVNHAEELSVLHWGFVPETHAKRQGYFKFVKSALL